MHSRYFRYASICLLTLLTTSTILAADKPNIIVIFTDDHGYSDLACQDVQQDLKTPHIDALAKGGARMTAGYVTAPQCVPSRAGLLSGRYQNRFGVESNGLPLDGFNSQSTIAERLKRVGYATGMTGKWHLGAAPEIVKHGFDDVYYKNANRPGWANFGLDGKDRDPGTERSGLYHLDANSAAACAFIKRHHDEPFFFYCAYRAPHVPLDAPPKYLRRFPGKMPERRRQALAMISAIDDGVGKIMQTLREYKLEEKTLIFFIGDNGAPLKIHKIDAPGGGPGWDGSLNDPYNGEKGMLTEGGIRVPFLAYWKGKIKPGLYDQPVISLDVAATAVALAGLPQDDQLDGVNLLPFLSGVAEGPPHDALYWRWIAQSAVRVGKWKYLRGGVREYLYDLSKDGEEKHNVANQHPEVVDQLRARLESWSSDLQPPGLATKFNVETWERYYDHYLDGKLAQRPAPNVASAASIQGWVARNSTASLANGALRITPNKVGKQRPFIARSRIKITGPATAHVSLRNEKGGTLGISWRLEGQKDFVAEQIVRVDVPASSEWQDVSLKLPTDNKIIHLRVLLPTGASTIREIKIVGSKAQERWQFSGH